MGNTTAICSAVHFSSCGKWAMVQYADLHISRLGILLGDPYFISDEGRRRNGSACLTNQKENNGVPGTHRIRHFSLWVEPISPFLTDSLPIAGE